MKFFCAKCQLFLYAPATTLHNGKLAHQILSADTTDFCSGYIREVPDPNDEFVLNRSVVMNTISRALQECFPDQKDMIIRELENRLPLNGRILPKIPSDDYPWWTTNDGRRIHIHDMSSAHLKSIVQMGISERLPTWKKHFERELIWRIK